MANYDSNYSIAQEISARIGVSPIPFDSVYSIALEIYNELGGEPAEFDSVYSILLGILPLVEGGVADKVIDDSVITTVKTWSSNKISSELGAKQDALTAGQNISIDSANTISADGYVYNASDGSFATKYLNTDEDESYIATNTASGEGAFAEGYSTTATGMANHAEGGLTQATGSQCSHAEGLMTVASGKQSHAEGYKSVASGINSHAEGGALKNLNPTTAAGNASHAEGYCTLALAQSSHSEGELTEAKNPAEHAQGNCNLSHKNSDNYGDAGNTMDSIGIGIASNNVPQRKNATEVMQNGDMYVLGVGGYQGTNTKVQDNTIKPLQTVISDINTAVAGKQDALTAGAGIEISGTTISATYEVATTADIEALFVLPSFYVDNALFETYNLTWGQWLDSRYNTSGFTHIYTAATYDSSVEQIPEVDSNAYPVIDGQYYSTCEDTAATGPANDEIWYTTSDGEIILIGGGGSGSGSGSGGSGSGSGGGWPQVLSNTYEDGKGVIKFTEDLTEIPFRGFLFKDTLTSIEIPNSVTSIVDEAFRGCFSLTSITIPDSVTIIGEYAFQNCKGLTSITIPDNVTSIEERVFYGCDCLTSVTIPDSVTSIGNYAFSSCKGLTSITIPDSVKSIGKYAFADCSSLASISYNGTMSDWNNIDLAEEWNYNVPATVVHCTDGDVNL